MTQVIFDRHERLGEVLDDLAGRERKVSVPVAVIYFVLRPVFGRSDQTGHLASWGRDALAGFRMQLQAERAAMPLRPSTTELMAEVANARENELGVEAIDIAMEDWDGRRSSMVDRRVARAALTSARVASERTRDGLAIFGEVVSGAAGSTLERIVDATFGTLNRDAAIESERLDGSRSGE